MRMTAAADEVSCTIVSAEEVLRGWLAVIHRIHEVHRQIPAYTRLEKLLDVMGDWEIVPFDQAAADQSRPCANSEFASSRWRSQK
jgi:hypothetical protein